MCVAWQASRPQTSITYPEGTLWMEHSKLLGFFKGQTKRDKWGQIRSCFVNIRWSLLISLLAFAAFGWHRFSQQIAGTAGFSQQTAEFRRNPFVPCSLSLESSQKLSEFGLGRLSLHSWSVCRKFGNYFGLTQGGVTAKVHSWTRVRRNGARGLCSGFSLFDCRNKVFWYAFKPVWLHLGYESVRACVVFGNCSQWDAIIPAVGQLCWQPQSGRA